MQTWQMQEAKARMAEVVKRAQTQGPQEITVHGRPAAVLLSKQDYDQLTGSGESLAAFMARSPLVGLDDLEFERDNSLPRDVSL